MTPLRAQICAEAVTWLGTPWQHQACLKGIAVDCVNFPLGVAQSLGLIAPAYRPPPYSEQWHFHRHEDMVQDILQELGCLPCELPDAQPGDVLGFQFGKVVSHLAFLLPGNCIIHAVRNIGKVVQHGLVGEYADRLRIAYRVPGVV